MTLSAGSRIGSYEITARIGAGGMGEVFRARDTRIGRDVAIKVLPPDVASDADRLRRFEQEARSAGSLNHTNLVTIHEFGTHDGAPYLVMELLDGETLREKLGDSTGTPRIPIRKSMEYGQQIATGLAAAHEKGIVHRDLKPENIFITRDGRVKILDFGLAKVNGVQLGDNDATEAKKTTPGAIVGTVGYMSPEQVRGRDVDHRTDIFSSGAILYEMISGRRAFRGDSSADTLSAILHEDPPELSASGHHVSPLVDRVIRRCLEKEKGERFESARDLAFALDTATTSTTSHETLLDTPASRGKALRISLIAAGALVITAMIGLIAWRAGRANAAPPRESFKQLTFEAGRSSSPSIAPDGKTFVFVKGEGPHRQLFLQRIDGRSALALSKSADDDDHEPAFSPDGSQIAFRSERAGGGIFVMGATGESVRRITSSGHNPAWTPDGKSIVFSSEEMLSPTSRASIASLSIADAASGTVRPLFKGDAMQPDVSPHQKRIAYWALPPLGGRRDIFTVAMNGDPKTIVAATSDEALDWDPVWAPDGRSIVFASDRGGTMNLWRLPIDEESGKPQGAPQPLSVPAMYAGHISIARNGNQLVYASQMTTNELRRGSIDAAGQTLTLDPRPVLSGSMLVRTVEPSPDGEWIALTTEERQEDVYVMKNDGSDLRQLTNDPARDRGASWWPDSSRIVFYSTRGGNYDCWSIRIDGSEATQLTKNTQSNFPTISPDAKILALFDLNTTQLWQVGGSVVQTLPPTPLGDSFFAAAFSPDSRRIAGAGWLKGTAIYTYSIPDRTYKVVLDKALPTFNRGVAVRSSADRGSMAFLDADHLLFGSVDGHVYVIDIATGAKRVIGDATSVTFSRNGRYFVSVTQHLQSDVWQLTMGER